MTDRRAPRPVRGKRGYGAPRTADVAELARRYLALGYEPVDVSQRLGVSKRWCYRNAPHRSDDE